MFVLIYFLHNGRDSGGKLVVFSPFEDVGFLTLTAGVHHVHLRVHSRVLMGVEGGGGLPGRARVIQPL